MESSVDPHDELRRLQDKVRKLELQNQQLRSQQFPKNGFDIDNKPNILSSLSDLDFYRNRLDQSNHNWDNEFLKPEELHWEHFENEEIWLYEIKSNSSVPLNLRNWLHQDINNHNDPEMLNIQNKLLAKVKEMGQGIRKNFIDTGTYTRPKKRLTRPGLEVVGEKPPFDNHKVFETPFKRMISKQITEMIDDISMNIDNSLLSIKSPSLSATFNKDITNLNATFSKNSPEKKACITQISPVNSTFVKYENDPVDHKSTDSDRSSNSRKTNDSFNATYVQGTNNSVASHIVSRIRNAGLNCTFTNDNNQGHIGTCDSGADDDQLSSASDSSFSSNTRLMNVGDVQTIARLQEENLKQMTSTPKRNNSKDGIIVVHGEDTFSPIKQATHELHQGYFSDHSDHSSVEGRSKSSVRSSPSSSPFGSTNALANEYCRPTSSMQRRDIQSTHPVNVPQDTIKTEPTAKVTTTGQRRVMSGLRPPSVRPSVTSRPSTAGSSNIPRPASRIPAPRVRSAYTSQAPASNWMDGCY